SSVVLNQAQGLRRIRRKGIELDGVSRAGHGLLNAAGSREIPTILRAGIHETRIEIDGGPIFLIGARPVPVIVELEIRQGDMSFCQGAVERERAARFGKRGRPGRWLCQDTVEAEGD